jgi:hypothetical protein
LPLPIPSGEWRKLIDSTKEQTSFPAQLVSPGKLEMRLPGESFVLYASENFIDAQTTK